MAITITYNQQYAFVAFTNHGFLDGDPIQVKDWDPPEFNGYFVVHYIDEDHFAYFVGDLGSEPITIITAGSMRGFSISYFTGIFYAGIGNYDIVQDKVSGDLLFLMPDNYMDAHVI